MRIVTWNVYRGEIRERAAELDALRPDLTVLQECGQPMAPQDGRCRWFGTVPIQGVGILSRAPWRLEPCTLSPDASDSAYPIRMAGPASSLNILAVWTKPQPTYVRALLTALDAYRDFLQDQPSIILGDFNSHWRWDATRTEDGHARLVEVLDAEFGLVSAYHAHGNGCLPGDEEPTLYWQWKAHQPYHVDYCFIPRSWVPHVRAVQVGTFAGWKGRSDHRPLIIDLEDRVLT